MFYATAERVILNRIELTKLQNTIGRLTNMNKKISPFFSSSAYKVGFAGNKKSTLECVRIWNKHCKSGDHSSPTRHGNISFKLRLYVTRRIQNYLYVMQTKLCCVGSFGLQFSKFISIHPKDYSSIINIMSNS